MTTRTQMPIQEYHGREYRDLKNCPNNVPMALLNEEQAQTNHSQNLDRLAERGGLSACETLALIERRPWHRMNEQAAIDYLNVHVAAHEQPGAITPYDTYRKDCKERGIPPMPQHEYKKMLRAAGSLAKVDNLYWTDETIALDGYHFRRCRFDNCQLIFSTTNYKLELCHIDSTCTIQAQE